MMTILQPFQIVHSKIHFSHWLMVAGGAKRVDIWQVMPRDVGYKRRTSRGTKNVE